MKSERDSLENIFAPAKESGFTASERQDMWHSLKSYAEFHPAKAPFPKKVFSRNILSWAGTITAGLLLFVGTGYAAQQSLPGDSLYALKVEVVEPIMGTLEISEADKLAYHVTLLERRLDEVQQLEEEGVAGEGISSVSSEYVEEHVSDLLAVVSSDSDETLPEEMVLGTLSRARGIARAHEITHDASFSNIEATEAIGRLDTAYEMEATLFAQEHPSQALTYIESILEEFDEATTASSTDSLEEVSQAELSEVAEALEEGSIDEALQSASDIQEEILVTEYLE